jgi:hypothetical protein
MVGSIRHLCAVAALMCSVLGADALTQAQHRYRNAASVCVDVTTKDYLSGPSFHTLREEASRIWLRHGIALEWTQPVPANCQTVVPVIFDDAALLKLNGGKPDQALARTVFHGHSRTIYVSADRAFDMLRNLTADLLNIQSVGEREVRGGTLLGRIVAHELGHVLLTTMSHSTSGLMRPTFGLRDVVSPDNRMTDLSPVETNRLTMRFSLEPLASEVLALRER